jgi:hypothetical protein
LLIYARIKGIKAEFIDALVAKQIKEMDLESFSNVEA